MNRRPRILFVCARPPYPPLRGDQVRAYHLARCIGQHADVRLVCLAGRSPPRPGDGFELEPVRPSVMGRVCANLRSPSPMLPLQVRAYLERRMHRVVREQVERWEPDVVHVTLSRMAPYMPGESTCHRHLDLVDSMALNMRERARSSRYPLRAAIAAESFLVGRFEARQARQADSVSVVAATDRGEPGLERAVVIPNGVDQRLFAYREPDVRAPEVIFFGNLGYFHNSEPASFLANEVIDRVRRVQGDAGLLLAGARPGPGVRRLAGRDGVELVPNPPAMAPLLHRAAVAAIPMFSGSGMKNKVLEAFSAGTPVVANAAGIEGIDEAIPGEHFILAEGADETVEAVTDLLANPAKRVRIARAAHAIAVGSYSWERQAARMMSAYGLPVEPPG